MIKQDKSRFISISGLFSKVYALYRSSHRKFSIKVAVLKIFAMFTGKHLFCSLFLIKLQTNLFFVIFIAFVVVSDYVQQNLKNQES